jgi:hypothetical protein
MEYIEFKLTPFAQVCLFPKTDINKFVHDAIKTRQFLIRNEKGRQDITVVESLGKLIRQWVYCPKRSPRNEAFFFLNNSALIETILPGRGCTRYEKMKAEFERLKELSIENTYSKSIVE